MIEEQRMNPPTPRQDKPEGVCRCGRADDTLQDAVLAAIRDLKDKGRSVATYSQIAHHNAVEDWREAQGSPWIAYGIIPTLFALCDQGLIDPMPDGWSEAE